MKATSVLGHASPSSSKCMFFVHPRQRLFSVPVHSINTLADSPIRRGGRIRCSKGKAVPPSELKENPQNVRSIPTEEELSPVMKFKMSDFELCDRVSVGLAGRVNFYYYYILLFFILYDKVSCDIGIESSIFTVRFNSSTMQLVPTSCQNKPLIWWSQL